MSNKLKTLSRKQLEDLISSSVGKYLKEDCDCKVSNMSYEDFNDEDVDVEDGRSISFEVKMHYTDPLIES